MRFTACCLALCWALCLVLQLAVAAEEGACQAGGSGTDATCTQQKDGQGEKALQVDWDKFSRDGYAVIPGVLRPEQVQRAKSAYKRSVDGVMGFMRWGSPLEMDPVFTEFIEKLPQELEAKIHGIIGPWSIGSYSYVALPPLANADRPKDREQMIQQRANRLHSDYPYGSMSCGQRQGAPRAGCLTKLPETYPSTVMLVFMLDDFTENNGGTLVLPGSHKNRTLPDGPADKHFFGERAVAAVGKAGDVLMYMGLMWHGEGVNVDVSERAAVLVTCVPFYMSPLQSTSYRLPNRIARTLSPKMWHRLGLAGYSPFKHTGQVAQGPPDVWKDGVITLWDAALMLYDALLYGYPTRYGLLEYSRIYVLGTLAAWLLLLFGRFWEAVKLLLATSLGLLVGSSMMLEKFQMHMT